MFQPRNVIRVSPPTSEGPSSTESNDHALKGLFLANRDRGEHIVTSAVEHPAVLQPLRFLDTLGAKVTVVHVDGRGRVDPDDVRRALTPRTLLVSTMHANNEVGTVQPIAEIAGSSRGRAAKLGLRSLRYAGHHLPSGQASVAVMTT